MSEHLYEVKQRMRKVEVKLPKLPNFILVEGGKSIPIQDLTDDSLKWLGQQWAKELVALAKKRRES